MLDVLHILRAACLIVGVICMIKGHQHAMAAKDLDQTNAGVLTTISMIETLSGLGLLFVAGMLL